MTTFGAAWYAKSHGGEWVISWPGRPLQTFQSVSLLVPTLLHLKPNHRAGPHGVLLFEADQAELQVVAPGSARIVPGRAPEIPTAA